MYKKFFRTVYQERLVFYYFKNNIKKIPQNGENAYLTIKKPQPVGAYFVCATPLCFIDKNRQKKIGTPHNQILDPSLASLHTFWSIYLVVNHWNFPTFLLLLNSKIPTFFLVLGIISYFFEPSYHLTPCKLIFRTFGKHAGDVHCKLTVKLLGILLIHIS